MILIADDNEYRRAENAKHLRNSGIQATSCKKEYINYMQLPIITVIVNPTDKDLENIYLETAKTLYVFVTRKKISRLENYKYCFIDEELKVDDKLIRNVALEKFNYTFENDCIGMFVSDYANSRLYMGGKNLMLTKTEYSIARFFLYNGGRTFDFDMVREYFGKSKSNKIEEVTFAGYISKINTKTKRLRTEKLIITESNGYTLNPELAEKMPNISN